MSLMSLIFTKILSKFKWRNYFSSQVNYEIWKTLRGCILVTEKILSISTLIFQQLYIFVSFLNSKRSSSRYGTKTFYNTNRIKNSIRSVMIFPTLFFLYFHWFFWKRKIHDRMKFSRARRNKKKEKGEILEKYFIIYLLSFPELIGWDNPNLNVHETLTSLYHS